MLLRPSTLLNQPNSAKWSAYYSGPILVLSASTIAEDAALTDVIGTLSVSNLGILTVSSYAITADPDAKFDLATADLIVDGALDYETATSHSVTIRVTLSDVSTVDRVFTITVTDVFEVVLVAPVLTWVSAADDNTPLFEGVFTDLQENDVGRLQIDDDVGFGSPIEAANTADAAEVLALQLDYTSGALADGQWWARVRHERGASVSAWSNVETETIVTAVASTPTYYYLGF